jgi:bacterioferritin-associated ferredoxin
MIVCSCNVISDHEVRDAASNPTTSGSMSRIYRTLGRKPHCGSCKRAIKKIVIGTCPTAMTGFEGDSGGSCAKGRERDR